MTIHTKFLRVAPSEELWKKLIDISDPPRVEPRPAAAPEGRGSLDFQYEFEPSVWFPLRADVPGGAGARFDDPSLDIDAAAKAYADASRDQLYEQLYRLFDASWRGDQP